MFAQATVLNYTHSGLNQDFLDLVTTLYDICNNFKFGILAKSLNFKTYGKIAFKGLSGFLFNIQIVEIYS